MDSAKTALSLMGGLAFGLTFVPYPLRTKLDAVMRDLWEKLFSSADPFAYIEVSRNSPAGMATPTTGVSVNPNVGFAHTAHNPFYAEVCLYLGSLNVEFAARRVSVSLMDLGDGRERPLSEAPKFVFGLPLNESLADTFEGAQFSWTHSIISEAKQARSNSQSDGDANTVFSLRMLKSDKHHLLHPYLNHISRVARAIKRQNILRSLYTNGRSGSHWLPVTLKHPSTFDTIALDGDLSERIQADLRAFSEAESYYHRIGRAWKRGYLLYGPPGTGKSSLIAAIANFLRYDIYDLELTNVFSNSALQNLLMQTTRKSVIVIEDIDCSARSKISHRQTGSFRLPLEYNEWEENFDAGSASHSQGITLSGLLNFADGLLSCYGEERIFIFTTNYRERLDSALLRRGRMDMHIHLSYCTFFMFKKLAVNYLGVDTHMLYGELEEAMRPGVKITPATIAEILISERKNPDEAIRQVIAAVKREEPCDADDNEHLTEADAENRIDTRVNGPREGKRKLLDGIEEEHPKGLAGKKQKGGDEEHRADLPSMEERESWFLGGKHKDNALHKKQEEVPSAELENLANGGHEGPAGDDTPTYGENQLLMEKLQTDFGLDVGKPIRGRSDMNVTDSDGRVLHDMIVDDSEDSSYEKSDLISCRWASQ